MKQIIDLETFSKSLSDKGYNGYFHTQSAHPGRLKESISDYLESCQKGKEVFSNSEFTLTGYLKWTGDEHPRIECRMRVKHENGNFELQKMEITQKDQFGQLLKQSKLENLSVDTMPKASEAIAMVSDVIEQETVPARRHFKL
ncbi:hypothetical protein [Flavobacterium sp. PL02]|uniref:hypothetical protein n=1 Tax=Flavobacterium sp. PL02 TaxID=3088354 RepID=UPI002B22AC5C|nr:hypothetical protein [Flavobacterium sp. PL02]MEA9412615.1 hypothetical protein [Flavobacterium sp. PL02]